MGNKISLQTMRKQLMSELFSIENDYMPYTIRVYHTKLEHALKLVKTLQQKNIPREIMFSNCMFHPIKCAVNLIMRKCIMPNHVLRIQAKQHRNREFNKVIVHFNYQLS